MNEIDKPCGGIAMQLISPTTVDAALGLLDQHVDQARIIAGGTDLVLDLKNRKSTPDMLISIHRIESLRGIERQNGSLVIGPNVSPAELMESPLVGEHAPLLRVAALEFGAPAVREMATIGGNIVTASPAADIGLALLASRAEVTLASVNGERTLALSEFFVGPRHTQIQRNELLTSIRIPVSPSPNAVGFVKIGTRKALAISIVAVAVALDLEDQVCRNACIALGAVAPTLVRASAAEQMLLGQRVTTSLIAEAAAQAAKSTAPIDDIRATAWYRQRVTPAVVARALSAAYRQPQ